MDKSIKKRIVMVNPGRRSGTDDPGDYRTPGGERTVIEPNALKHMKHARMRLIAPYNRDGKPYLASAAMALKMVARPGYGTLGVDSSWRLYYDPKEIIYWPVDALAAVIEHELWHLLREHHRRAQNIGINNSTGFRWNIAADTEIHSNERLLEDVRKVPESDPAHPEKYGLPRKKTVEYYYENLPHIGPLDIFELPPYEYSPWTAAREAWEEWEENRRMTLHRNAYDYEGHWPPPHFPGGGEGDGDGGDDLPVEPGEGEGEGEGQREGESRGRRREPIDWQEYRDPTKGVSGSCADGLPRDFELPPTDETVNRAEEATIRREVARAIQGAKSRGEGVGDWVAEWAELELMPAKVDWRDLLRNAIESAIQYQRGNLEYTWGRLSRRQAASPDFLLPGMHSPIPEIAVVLDTSGSMFTAAYSPESDAAAEEGAHYSTLLESALHEIGGILEEYGTTVGVNILATDTAVQSAARVYEAEDLTLLGGGGTDMGIGLMAAALFEPPHNVCLLYTSPSPRDQLQHRV